MGIEKSVRTCVAMLKHKAMEKFEIFSTVYN